MQSNSDNFYEDDFVKTVLGWSFDLYREPLGSARRKPALPKREQNITRYYHNFLPFILEEARAIIASGLEKAEQYISQASNSRRRSRDLAHLSDAKPFRLTLQKNASYPRNEGNPLSMTFRGAVPDNIEHGKSMIVLLLKTTDIDPPKQFIALATENMDATQLYAKIILSHEDYHAYSDCFVADDIWEAHYLGSVISEQRMYDACLEAKDSPCIRQIARATIASPNTRTSNTSADLGSLNLSQRHAIYGFLNARENNTLLLEGPPGTGKTTTLVSLLAEVVARGKRTLVSAHSNKGVQVLASRALEKLSDVPMILVGVESKLPEHLKPIFLHRWHVNMSQYLFSFLEKINLLTEDPTINIGTTANVLLNQLESNIQLARTELDKFLLIDTDQLHRTYKEALYQLTNNPIKLGDFQRLNQAVANLASTKTKKKWKALQTSLNVLLEKWSAIVKQDLEMYLLNSAQVVFATLITCGRKSLIDMDDVDYLLVDEASQSVEPATLIPMKFNPTKVLLVGDTKQLPATVISPMLDDSHQNAISKNYQWSMMWRLIEENRQPNLMLTIQYRMHPWICQWPSGQFYNDRLITSPDILPVNALSNTGITSQPYAVYQVAGQVESRDSSHSISNPNEASYVLSIIEHIRRRSTDCSIGVITPYTAQKQLINYKLQQKRHLLPSVDVNTVDGFQGDERDVIIISFVRTHVSQFLKEFRRLNVAITRAKACLIILGSPGLVSNDIGALIQDARKRNLLYTEDALKFILRTGNTATTEGQNSQRIDLRSRAWQADPQSQYDYGTQFESSNQRLAYLWLRRAAENAYPLAQLKIAQAYFSGNAHIPQDAQLAISWLNKAVNHPLPEAHFFLGKLFIVGESIVQNIDAGLVWCKRASDANYLESHIFLAHCYENGKGLIKNIPQAIIYYRKAAKLNHQPSIFTLAALLSEGSSDNKREAIKWYKKSAGNNNQLAYYPLAELLSNVLNNQSEAFTWYLKAADNGNAAAQYEVAIHYKYGYHLCEINLSRAAHYLQLAADNHHTHAQYVFAKCLLQGEGVLQSDASALAYFEKSAMQGHPKSQYQAGLLLLHSNPTKAYRYFNRAAKTGYAPALYESIKYQIQHDCDLNDCLIFSTKLLYTGNNEEKFIAARLLDTGLGHQTDKQIAYNYYAQLVAAEHIFSKFYLAVLLEEGEVATRDLEAAKSYYEACLTHQPKAKLYLARLLLQYYGDQSHSISALDLIKDFFDSSQENTGLTALESKLEKLISRKIPQDNSAFIAAINTSSRQANYHIGLMFKEGNQVQQSTEQAKQFLKKAADAEDAESQYQYALLISETSPSEGYTYFLKAALQNYLLAQWASIRFQITADADLAHCLTFCESLAENGNPQAKFLLARMLETGVSGTIDKPRAREIYQSLSEQQDNISAHYHYARMLEEDGLNLTDLNQAIDLYAQCFETYPDARLRYACLILREEDHQQSNQYQASVSSQDIYLSEIDGNTIPCLPRSSHRQSFFQPANDARQGVNALSERQQLAMEALTTYYQNNFMTNAGLEGALEEALEKLIRKHNVNATFYVPPFIKTEIAQANLFLGKIYQEGSGVRINYQRAIQYYQKAAREYPEAHYLIGYFYEAGSGVAKSWSTAKSYYQAAADKGHELAKKRLGWSYSVFGGKTMTDAELSAQKSCVIM